MQKPNRKRQAKGVPKDFATLTPTRGGGIPKGALKLYEACKFLNLSRPTLQRLVARGLLRPNRSTRHLLFPVEELQRFLREGQVE